MKRAAWICMASLIVVCLSFNPASAWFAKKPTAIIVDDETGEPIEGAIALAQWVKYSATLFEGGVPYAAKAEEAVSDKEGKIYIKGYWTFNPFACERHLTVYKPGYALWNSKKEAVYPRNYQPKEFTSDKNVVRMVKFERAAIKWKENSFSEFEKKNPRQQQAIFLGNCFELELAKSAITIDEVFKHHEMDFIRKEKEQSGKHHEN